MREFGHIVSWAFFIVLAFCAWIYAPVLLFPVGLMLFLLHIIIGWGIYNVFELGDLETFTLIVVFLAGEAKNLYFGAHAILSRSVF